MKEYVLPKEGHTPSNSLKAAFHKFYLVHSWILCHILRLLESHLIDKMKIVLLSILKNLSPNATCAITSDWRLKNRKNKDLRKFSYLHVLKTISYLSSFFYFRLVLQMINAKASFLLWRFLLVKYILWKPEKPGKLRNPYSNKASWSKNKLRANPV